jgi:protein PhnA
MSEIPNCPLCDCDYAYEDRNLIVCPECAHEWTADSVAETADQSPVFKDANGTILAVGDTVSLIKDLPIKGSASKIKAGTKVKNIRLVEGDHNIDCKVDGVGVMMLKSEFVKKV